MVCTKCQQDKPATTEFFRAKKKTANGHDSKHGICQPCRECKRIQDNEYNNRPENRNRRTKWEREKYDKDVIARQKKLDKKNKGIFELSDTYMKHRLRGLGITNYTKGLINIKRINLACKRHLKRINNTIKINYES